MSIETLIWLGIYLVVWFIVFSFMVGRRARTLGSPVLLALTPEECRTDPRIAAVKDTAEWARPNGFDFVGGFQSGGMQAGRSFSPTRSRENENAK
jgi:hypothetical protein